MLRQLLVAEQHKLSALKPTLDVVKLDELSLKLDELNSAY